MVINAKLIPTRASTKILKYYGIYNQICLPICIEGTLNCSYSTFKKYIHYIFQFFFELVILNSAALQGKINEQTKKTRNAVTSRKLVPGVPVVCWCCRQGMAYRGWRGYTPAPAQAAATRTSSRARTTRHAQLLSHPFVFVVCLSFFLCLFLNKCFQLEREVLLLKLYAVISQIFTLTEFESL